jgi:carbamoyltransferase
MIILGLSTMGNSAACIVVDGNVVAAIEEERLTRLKNDGGFPYESIKMCLDITGIALSEVDEIAVYWQPWRVFDRGVATMFSLIGNLSNAKFVLKRVKDVFSGKANDYPELRGSWLDLFKIKYLLKKKYGDFTASVKYFDHHDCHAASVYYISNFDKSICLTYDGGGESHSTVIYKIDNGKFEKLKIIAWPNSLGHFYSAFTGFLGFRMLEGEYKMMGLSPYGEPRFKDIILTNILTKMPNGDYKLNTTILNYHAALRGRFSKKLIDLIGTPRKPNDEFTQFHRDVAASVQSAFEEILVHLLSWAKQKLPDYNSLCIAGGCGLNVSANGQVSKKGFFKNILIPPAPHDAGASIGAAFLSYIGSEKNKIKVVSMESPYLGKTYSDNDICEIFERMDLPIPELYQEEQLIEIVSEALSNKNVVAWFQGGSEFGPRALGNRSFLADPRHESIREILNVKIKKRELFRPFAPSCKEESASEYFEINQKSPYMNIVAKVKVEKLDIIPAITHIDGSARVHTVSKNTNKLYWKLLDSFESKTGVSVLLNTSFNIQEPIVESPSQAIDCFLRSSVDFLAIGGYICDHKWREIALKDNK